MDALTRVDRGTAETNRLIPLFCKGFRLIGLEFLHRIASWR